MLAFVAIAACLALVAKGCPTPSDDTTDVSVLNFALTLEYLESAFYSNGLNKYDDSAFQDAGYPSWVRRRFTEIANHEAAHVALLQTALGDQAVQPCQYNFPDVDPASFVALSMVLENVGVSAYIGALNSLSNPQYVNAAASILSVEARHGGWVNSAVRKQAAWGGAVDVGLTQNQVSSIVAAFISSCPTTNSLSIQALPSLQIETCSYAPGDSIDISYDASSDNTDDQPHYLALFAGLTPTFLDICDDAVDLPMNISGVVYAVVTTSDSVVTDANTIAGPAILYLPDL